MTTLLRYTTFKEKKLFAYYYLCLIEVTSLRFKRIMEMQSKKQSSGALSKWQLHVRHMCVNDVAHSIKPNSLTMITNFAKKKCLM